MVCNPQVLIDKTWWDAGRLTGQPASAQPGMQISLQRSHLLIGKSTGKGGHHSLPCQHVLPYSCVRGSSAAGQGLAVKYSMQVRRDFLEPQVVVLVAMGAANLIKVLPFRLLRSERRR